MANQEIYLEMNGKNIGIAIYSYIINDFLSTKSGERILCVNVNQAKLTAIRFGLTNPLDYELYIIIDDSTAHICYFDLIGGQYQMYSDDDKLYYVKPQEKFSVEKVGYIIFNNNEKNVINTEEDKARIYSLAEENFNTIKEAASTLVKYPNKDYALESVDKFWSNTIIKVKNTSGVIHILYNSQIMNINMNRKNMGLRSFRFDTGMDKYNTLYFFIRKDFYENNNYKTIETSMNALQMIVDEASKIKPGIQIKYVDMYIPIEIDDNIIKYNMRKVKREENKG